MNKLFAVFLLSAMLLALTFETANAGDKGGDTIILGGGDGGGGGFGGGQPTVIKSGGKKGGNIIYIGRRKRDVEKQQPLFTIYRVPTEK